MPDGKKDEERSAYTLTSYLKKSPWTFNSRWSSGTTQALVQYDRGGMFSFQTQAVFFRR